MRGVGAADEPSNQTGGTWVAIAYAVLAVALVGSWSVVASRTSSLTPFLFACLLATAFLAERIALPLSPRGWYTVSTPVVVLTGLLGGPAAGALAGAATALGDGDAAWRRRVAFGGLDAVRGFAAGLIGLIPITGATGSGVRAALAVSAALALNAAGRLVIHRARRIGQPIAFRRGALADGLEAVAAVPVLALILQSYEAHGAVLVVLALAGLLVALWLGTEAFRRSHAELAAEQHLARTDPLTGAPNRRALEEELARVHGRVVRGERAAGLLVLDLDHFKRINDEHGWDRGDVVLLELVERIEEGLRDTDLLARRGGEEFAVIAPGVESVAGLHGLAETIRLRVRALPFAEDLAVTVSIGAALMDESTEPAVAEHRANDALGRAKSTRDAVAVWEELEAEGGRAPALAPAT